MLATDWPGVGTALLGLAAVITACGTVFVQTTTGRRTRERVDEIHDEVKSANGITGTELLERAEGRRIEEIPHNERTRSESGYVERLHQQGRNMGHDDEPGVESR